MGIGDGSMAGSGGTVGGTALGSGGGGIGVGSGVVSTLLQAPSVKIVENMAQIKSTRFMVTSPQLKNRKLKLCC